MEVVSFARGIPAPECLPAAELADCARSVLERDGERALNYGPAAGYLPLREWLAERHGVDTDCVFLTNGSLQALHLLLTRYATDRRVLVEAPTYDRVLRIARHDRGEVVGVPHDRDGIDLEELAGELRRNPSPALLYVMPTFQNPTGRVLPLDRRRQLLQLAAEHDLVLYEDDPYRLVRFEGDDVPSLYELGESDRIFYASSFSKIVAPGLRAGYLVVPPGVAEALADEAASTYLAPTFAAQAIVFEFLQRGLLEPNVERVNRLLGLRRDAMLSALEQELPGATWNTPAGGYFLWLELPEGVGARDLSDAAAGEGVTFVAGEDFFARAQDGRGEARLAFSFASVDEIAVGIRRLAAACASLS